MPTLTARQRAALAFIVGYVGRHMTSPSIRDIGVALGIRSPNGVIYHLRTLRRKGYVELPADGSARGIRVVGLAAAFVKAATDYLAELGAQE